MALDALELARPLLAVYEEACTWLDENPLDGVTSIRTQWSLALDSIKSGGRIAGRIVPTSNPN